MFIFHLQISLGRLKVVTILGWPGRGRAGERHGSSMEPYPLFLRMKW
jgi:hypothetical protein